MRCLSRFFLLIIPSILLVSCSPKITRYGYTYDEDNLTKDCDVIIKKNAQFDIDKAEVIGKVKIGDTGFTTKCSKNYVLKLLRDEACYLGANIVNIIEEKQPGFWSSCYRATAELLEVKDKLSLITLVDDSSYSLSEIDTIVTIPTSVPKFRFGFGFEVTQPVYGPHMNFYYRGISLGLTYGVPSKTHNSKRMITDIDFSYHATFSFTFGSIYSSNLYWPLIMGVGYSYINEKDNVMGYTGEGTITGTHYYVGLLGLWVKEGFLKHFGVHMRLGYNDWDFNNSVLTKNNADLDYNYFGLYFSLGAYYYIK